MARIALLALLLTLNTTAISSAMVTHGSDFAEWKIQPVSGFPKIDLVDDHSSSSETQSEVRFKYSLSGTHMSTNSLFTTNLLRDDCITPGSPLLKSREYLELSSNEFSLDVFNLNRETITNTVHYHAIDEASAEINFCVRVNYEHKDKDGMVRSVDVHETIVDIRVDLTANNFTLSSIASHANLPDNEEEERISDAYPVETNTNSSSSTNFMWLLAIIVAAAAGYFFVRHDRRRSRRRQQDDKTEAIAKAEEGEITIELQDNTSDGSHSSLSTIDVFDGDGVWAVKGRRDPHPLQKNLSKFGSPRRLALEKEEAIAAAELALSFSDLEGAAAGSVDSRSSSNQSKPSAKRSSKWGASVKSSESRSIPRPYQVCEM